MTPEEMLNIKTGDIIMYNTVNNELAKAVVSTTYSDRKQVGIFINDYHLLIQSNDIKCSYNFDSHPEMFL